jgi:F-type H+-transporting ATPase subunit gamma
VVVGRKARDFYRRRRDTEVRAEHVNILEGLTYTQASRIAQELMRPYIEGEVDEVELVYTEFRSVASQRVVVEDLLPIRPPADAVEDDSEEYLFEPSAEAVLAQLLPRHVEVQVYRALLESVAAEYGARMTAMENATRNAAEMIEVLTIQFNKARQERITKELLEIVSGAEALRQASE